MLWRPEDKGEPHNAYFSALNEMLKAEGPGRPVLLDAFLSLHDTIVVYDRIRENMQRMRDVTLYRLINISTSQTLSRTILTGITTVLSIVAFFFWGTPVIRDFAFALLIGVLIGTYSSIYIAAPLTEWMDRKFFTKA